MSIASSSSGFASDTEPPFGVDGPWADAAGAAFGGGGGAGGSRTPPQDNDAEQSVLGSMLLSKDAIADVVEAVRGGDFYRPVHETIFDAMVDLYGRGEPVDPITTTAELQRRGELARVGGAPYLHTLSAGVPIAANAGYYAEIVREKAILRRLVDAGTRIAQMGYAGEGQVDDVVDRAQAEVYGVTDQRASEDYAPLSAIMESTLDEIEAINNRDGEMVGVPTGFADLDELTNGLHPGQMVIVAARPAMGKALALDTPLATPTGWTTMGEVEVGDLLYDRAGRPTTVVAATEVLEGRACYEVVFGDGSRIVADALHQWRTESGVARATTSVVTTEQLAAALRAGAGQPVQHTVASCEPLLGADPVHPIVPRSPRSPRLPALPVAPYALGAWLGGAHPAPARLTSPSADAAETAEIAMLVEATGHADPGTFRERLRGIGVLPDVHIPSGYLRASQDVRRELLAGLLDARGVVVRRDGSVRVTVTGARLAADVHDLVVGLGYPCARRPRVVGGRAPGSPTAQELTFSTADDVFRVHRKAVLHKELRTRRPERTGRLVVDVRPVPSVPVRCVQVDNDEHLYLAGRSMIPTHNSTLGLDLCRSASIRHNMTSVIFSLEMTRNEITMRLLSAEAKIPLNHMRNGNMNDDDWTRLARKMGEVSSSPLFIDDSPNMTMMEIRAKARRLKQRHDLRLIVIDYMQLMTSGKKVESRQLEVSEFSRQIKLLAKELEIPVVALSQLNRGAEQRSDKRPMMSDLRESGCLTGDTRLLRADTNAEVTLGELMGSGARDVPVWSLDDRLKLVPRTLTHAFPSGTKQVYRLTLGSGREVKATASHRFLTYDGWVPLTELRVGTRLGSLRHVPPPLQVRPREDAEVVSLARDLRGSVPEWAFSLPQEQVGLLLRHLWARDGSVKITDDGWSRASGRVQVTAASRRLADDLARLLLRLNVFARIRAVGTSGDGDSYRVQVTGAADQLRFLEHVGVHGPRSARMDALSLRLRAERDATEMDTVPDDVWERVRDALADERSAHPEPAAVADGPRREPSTAERPPRGGPLAAVAGILGDADLDVLATNDVRWDSVASVEPLGEEPVFDATVLGTHNFVVEGLAAHNSLEQDADMVILLHREDVYERESTRPGEADLIVAKHRNGPTRDLTVAFQGHYSRFVDMAHG